MQELSRPQKLIYDMEQYAGGAIAVICGSMVVKGRMDTAALENAVNAVYQYNEALRIRIVKTEQGVRQTVSDFTRHTVEIMHFKNKEDLDLYAKDYAKKPIELSGTLCKIKIVCLCDGYGILIKLHHLIGDAWTLALICSQFNSFLKKEKITAYSYRNYVNKEQCYLQSAQYTKDRDFFLKRFEVCEDVTYLSEKQSKSFSAERSTFTLDADQSKRLRTYADNNHVSVFALFLAAFAVYMNRTKRNLEKFYIGTAVLNRAGVKERNTIGMFINTVPVLISLDNESTFEKNLLKVQEEVLSTFRHQKFNYGEILAEVRKVHHFTEKLYDVIISYQNAVVDNASERSETTWYHSGVQTESLQIHIDDRDSRGVFRFHFDYQTEKYAEDEIEQMYHHVLNLLSDAVENENKKLYELTMLSMTEKNRLMYAFNDNAVDYPKDQCVHHLFEEQAAETPDKTAVIACDRVLTYAELNEQANRIAHSLIEKKVKVGDIVAFALPRKSYLLSVIFGILKAGAAYMPIDLETPQHRIDYMLDDSRARFLITEEQVGVLLESDRIDNPQIVLDGDALCYCIYTSGSTGNPKGVLIRHRNLINFCNVNEYNNYQYNAVFGGKILLSTLKSCFDAFEDYALFLLNGNSIVLAGDKDIADGDRLAKLAEENKVEVLQSTASIMKLLCSSTAYLDMLKKIKVIVMGGERLLPDLYFSLRTATDAIILNGYGPTEATIGVSFGEINSGDIHIGRPIANTQIYIVDQYRNLCPVGVTGELCIAGDGVGIGYLNRPELTAEKFIDNPFGKGKLYQTGDLAYWRNDGRLAYVGRNDFQVKIRGLRIELGEIENTITRIEGISQTVVVVREDDSGRQVICAFYTGEKMESGKIRSALSKTLPRYMLPGVLVHLDEFPLTTNGKVNRKALPKVDWNNIDDSTEYVKPEGELEQQLAMIIGLVLGYDLVGRNDHFFDNLGGDSLKMIEFVSKAHNEGIYFSVQDVFDYPTVRRLAESITKVNDITINGTDEKKCFSEMDFKKINLLLEKNKAEYMTRPTKKNTGNMLLAGATGYLGIHILADFLDCDDGTAICLVRGVDRSESKKRLADLLQFYFGNRYTALIDSRVEVLCADLQKEDFGLSKSAYEKLSEKADIVINAAASVKHYGSYQYFWEVNVETVNRIIDFCIRYRKRLIHISTLSVSGYGFMDKPDGDGTDRCFHESDLFIGQALGNVYIRSKFEAERAVLEAVSRGFCANIMRMGNLMNRWSDGVFQKNYESNAFLRKIKAILTLGVFPKSLAEYPIEFTPVDEAARAVMTIARHFGTEQTVFHINNPRTIRMDKLFSYFNEMGYYLKFTEESVFADIVQQTAQQSDREFVFETFIGDIDVNGQLGFGNGIHVMNDFSVLYLKQLGFEWPDIGKDYLQRYITYFKKIGYLEG